MNKWLFILGTIVLLGLALLAAGVALVGNYLKQQAPPTEVNLEFATVLSGGSPYRQEEPSFAVTANAEELAYYKEMLAPADLQGVFKIDLTRYFVIVAFQGGKATGGYRIEIKSIVQSGDRIVVTTYIKEPQPGETVDLGGSSPLHVVKVAKPNMPRRGSLTFVFKDTLGNLLAEKVCVIP